MLGAHGRVSIGGSAQQGPELEGLECHASGFRFSNVGHGGPKHGATSGWSS